MPITRSCARAVLFTGAVGAAALAGAGVSAAHVVTDPGQAAPDEMATITFRVPNEETAAGTVRLEVTSPTDHPITTVYTTPVPGCAAQVSTVALPQPAPQPGHEHYHHGGAAAQAVRSVTWTPGPAPGSRPASSCGSRCWPGPCRMPASS